MEKGTESLIKSYCRVQVGDLCEVLMFKVFGFIFLFLTALVTVKFGQASYRWSQLEKENREPYWEAILRDVFGIKK